MYNDFWSIECKLRTLLAKFGSSNEKEITIILPRHGFATVKRDHILLWLHKAEQMERNFDWVDIMNLANGVYDMLNAETHEG